MSSIPKHEAYRLHILELLESEGPLTIKESLKPIAERMNLSTDQRSEAYDSGSGSKYPNRLAWAFSYLYMSDMVDRPKRGLYHINDDGRRFMNAGENELNGEIKKRLAYRDKKKKEQQTEDDSYIAAGFEEVESLTPQEHLFQSFQKIKDSIYEEVLSTVLSKSPFEFEKIVVMLLQKMGYGGQISDSGFVTKASNDGGIDGVIKEDVLGLGRIHIQAKRYKKDNSIGREDIQKFVGALAVAQSNKGVFITTSYFSKGAREYVENLNGSTNIILIDGKQLAEYMYEYGLGMQVEQTVEIKRLDADFWDNFQED